MKKLIAAITLAALTVAVPAAAASDCTSAPIKWLGTSPLIDGGRTQVGSATLDIHGQFAVVTTPETATIAVNGTIIATAGPGAATSVGVPSDAETIDVCIGGSDDVPEAAGQEVDAVGGEEVEREQEEWQTNVDVDAERWNEWTTSHPAGVHPI